MPLALGYCHTLVSGVLTRGAPMLESGMRFRSCAAVRLGGVAIHMAALPTAKPSKLMVTVGLVGASVSDSP